MPRSNQLSYLSNALSGPFCRGGRPDGRPGKRAAIFGVGAHAVKDRERDRGRGEAVESKVLGDWAWLRNHLTVTVTRKGGQPATRAGYVLTILQRQADGAWVITRDANLLG